MKTIVISGAHSNVGKTTLAGELKSMLPNASVVKIGHGIVKPEQGPAFYPMGTPFDAIADENRHVDFLIIEGNSILREITPDLCLFLEGNGDKPSADMARDKSDLRSHRLVPSVRITELSGKLGIPESAMKKIAWLAGARLQRTAAVIMAGGKSRRMGKDKSRLEINGKSLLNGLRDQLSTGFDRIYLSVAASLASSTGGMTVIPDRVPNRGPLGGLVSVLHQSDVDVHFVVACDIPCIHPRVLRKLLSELENHDVVVPSFEQSKMEPLFAVYSRQILERAESHLQEGDWALHSLINAADARIVPFQDSDWYVNLNTPQDVEAYAKRDGPRIPYQGPKG